MTDTSENTFTIENSNLSITETIISAVKTIIIVNGDQVITLHSSPAIGIVVPSKDVTLKVGMGVTITPLDDKPGFYNLVISDTPPVEEKKSKPRSAGCNNKIDFSELR